MPNTTQNVIVTGAAGFIGSHLAAALRQPGRRVVGIDNFDPFYDRSLKSANIARIQSFPQDSAGFHCLEANICDADAMQQIFIRSRPAAVFHIAALAGVRPSLATPARFAAVNVNGLVNVLDAARAAGCRHVIFASSSSVYGNNKKVPFSEVDPAEQPISPYAATKRTGELICQAYAHLFNMRIAALRFFTVFGAAQRPDLAIGKFMRLIAAGDDVPMFGDGSTSRDYTYIDDIIQGVMAAYDVVVGARAGAKRSAEPFFRIYNLGNSHPVTLADMIDSIANVVGKPARLKRLPMQPGEVQRTFADLKRSESELHYRPRTAFRDGLAKQWHWLRSHCPSVSAVAPIVT